MKEIRLLKAEEIECRVGTIGQKGLSLLLYKDARVDMKILDEVFTPTGWKRSHQSIDCPVVTDIISIFIYSSGVTDAKKWFTGSSTRVSLRTS